MVCANLLVLALALAQACVPDPALTVATVAGITGVDFQLGETRQLAPLGINKVQLMGAGVLSDPFDGTAAFDPCVRGLYWCDTEDETRALPSVVRLCGNLSRSSVWVVLVDDTQWTYITVAPGSPVALHPVGKTAFGVVGAALPPLYAESTDSWGNPTSSEGTPLVVLRCVYGDGGELELFGVTEREMVNGSVVFDHLIPVGAAGACDLDFVSTDLIPGFSAESSGDLTLYLSPGDPNEVVLTLQPDEYELDKQTTTISNQAYLTVVASVVDIGKNPLRFPLCVGYTSRRPGIPEFSDTDYYFGQNLPLYNTLVISSSGTSRCILINVEWLGDPGIEQEFTAESAAKTELRSNDTYAFYVPAVVGVFKFEARLPRVQNSLLSSFVLTVADRGEFRCVTPIAGTELLSMDLTRDLIDSSTMAEITKTFFDLDVPPAPFVRFNVTTGSPSSWHFEIPAASQSWVLMDAAVYIRIDPVLAEYFAFGFRYARVDDLTLRLLEPFCASSDLDEVVAELAILLFDLGDSSAQYHKTRGLSSSGAARFGNYTGFIPRVEKLEVCVGDRILSPAVPGWHIKCCDRDSGSCLTATGSKTVRTIVIAVAIFVVTLAAAGHLAWIIKCLRVVYFDCLSFRQVDTPTKVKIVVVHVVAVIFPLFSTLVNIAYMKAGHPLVILWGMEFASMGFWIVVCLCRVFPVRSPRLRRLYHAAVLQLGFVSLWLIWAAWAWTVPAMFLETRRALVPFVAFTTLIAHCLLKPGVIASLRENNLGVFGAIEVEGQEMLLDAVAGTACFAAFLTALVYALNSFEVVSDTQLVLAVLVVLGVGFFMSWSLTGRFAAALRKTVSESAERAGALAMEALTKKATNGASAQPSVGDRDRTVSDLALGGSGTGDRRGTANPLVQAIKLIASRARAEAGEGDAGDRQVELRALDSASPVDETNRLRDYVPPSLDRLHPKARPAIPRLTDIGRGSPKGILKPNGGCSDGGDTFGPLTSETYPVAAFQRAADVGSVQGTPRGQAEGGVPRLPRGTSFRERLAKRSSMAFKAVALDLASEVMHDVAAEISPRTARSVNNPSNSPESASAATATIASRLHSLASRLNDQAQYTRGSTPRVDCDSVHSDSQATSYSPYRPFNSSDCGVDRRPSVTVRQVKAVQREDLIEMWEHETRPPDASEGLTDTPPIAGQHQVAANAGRDATPFLSRIPSGTARDWKRAPRSSPGTPLGHTPARDGSGSSVFSASKGGHGDKNSTASSSAKDNPPRRRQPAAKKAAVHHFVDLAAEVEDMLSEGSCNDQTHKSQQQLFPLACTAGRPGPLSATERSSTPALDTVKSSLFPRSSFNSTQKSHPLADTVTLQTSLANIEQLHKFHNRFLTVSASRDADLLLDKDEPPAATRGENVSSRGGAKGVDPLAGTTGGHDCVREVVHLRRRGLDEPWGFHLVRDSLVLRLVDGGSPAARAGLGAFVGRRLLEVGGRRVRTLEQAKRQVDAAAEVDLAFAPCLNVGAAAVQRLSQFGGSGTNAMNGGARRSSKESETLRTSASTDRVEDLPASVDSTFVHVETWCRPAVAPEFDLNLPDIPRVESVVNPHRPAQSRKSSQTTGSNSSPLVTPPRRDPLPFTGAGHHQPHPTPPPAPPSHHRPPSSPRSSVEHRSSSRSNSLLRSSAVADFVDEANQLFNAVR
eukprot:gene13048-20125_t